MKAPLIDIHFYPTIKNPLYFIRKGLLDKINQYASTLNGKLLDFGCGAKPYKNLFTNISEYIGVDYHSEGHSHKDENIDFFYDGKTLPFKDNEFDSIFSSEVFEHVFNLEEIIKELNRVLKPNGKLFFTCPFVWHEHEVPVDYARYTQYALKHLLEKNNFKIILIDKSGNFISTIWQLKVLYFTEHIIPKLPTNFLKKIARQIVIPILNLYASVLIKILPTKDDLYLNNIILSEKII